MSQMRTDPRTVARQIPGLLDDVLPQLTPGLVSHFNSSANRIEVESLNASLLHESKLQRAMLFELGYAVAEQMLLRNEIDWEQAGAVAVSRQRKFYDASIPEHFDGGDKILAEIVARNLVLALGTLSTQNGGVVISNPVVPGFEWISTGTGDFSLGESIVEVKCSSRNFTTADYRQVIVYWLLSYAAALEGRGTEWREVILLNPRTGRIVRFKIDSFIAYTGSGMAKIEILQAFQAVVGSRLQR
ncbi:MAG: hypothetical protein EOO88_35850 [Pedobacter sp.]|nr:MAG: hypothetical protein EOO88_35850 [Pedobacter sp.]